MDFEFMGIVTLGEGILSSLGTYRHGVWARRWQMVGPAEAQEEFDLKSKPRLASDADWMLVGYGDGPEPKVVIPGCKVHVWLACSKPSGVDTCWIIE